MPNNAFQIGSGGASTGADPTDATATTVTINVGPAALASFQPPSGHPNPYAGDLWGPVTIGIIDLPGIIEEIDGCKTPEEWTQQKGTNGNFATSVWKGSKLAEGIKIKMHLVRRGGMTAMQHKATFDAIYPVRDALRPKRGNKPPSLRIKNHAINFVGVNFVVIAGMEPPKWRRSGNSWEWDLEVNEYNPGVSANTGAADPASTTGGDNGALQMGQGLQGAANAVAGG